MRRVGVEVAGHALDCAVALTAAEQARGLQGHAPLDDGSGMLFAFSPPRRASFHMGRVAYPIDLLFADADGRITRLVHSAQPGSRSTWTQDGVGLVVETPGGWCQARGIDVGGLVHVAGRRWASNSYNILRTITEADLDPEAAFRKLGPDAIGAEDRVGDGPTMLGPGYNTKEPLHEAPDFGGAIRAVPPEEQFQGHGLPDTAFPEAMGGVGGDMGAASSGWQDVGGYDQKYEPYRDPLSVDMEGKDSLDGDEGAAAVRMSAEVHVAQTGAGGGGGGLAVDFTQMVPELIEGAVQEGLPWRPTYVNPHREMALVSGKDVGRWLHRLGLDDSQVSTVWDIATSPAGLDKLADGFLLADDDAGRPLVDSANIQGHGDSPVLVLTRRIAVTQRGRSFGDAVQDYQASERQAREVRRAMRSRLWEQLPAMLGRKTASGWNLPVTPDEVERGMPIGSQHPGTAAIIVVRKALSQYDFPSDVDLRYVGMKRISGHGATAMDEGLVFVEANFQGASGPKFAIDIPVVVHEGRMLDPSILIHAGTPRVITQNTLDDIMGLGEFTAKIPDRPHMFSPPPDKKDRQDRGRMVLHRPGMFDIPEPRSLHVKLRASKQAAVRAAVTGVGIRTAQYGSGPEDELDWADTGDTGWGHVPNHEPAEPEWADAGQMGGGSGGEWIPDPGPMPGHPDHLSEEWAEPGQPGHVPPIGSESPNLSEEWEPQSLAHQFMRENPGFDWSESSMPLAWDYAEQHDIEVPDFLDALNNAEYSTPGGAPNGPGPMESPEMLGPGGDGSPVEGYESMRSLHPLDDPEASAHRAALRVAQKVAALGGWQRTAAWLVQAAEAEMAPENIQRYEKMFGKALMDWGPAEWKQFYGEYDPAMHKVIQAPPRPSRGPGLMNRLREVFDVGNDPSEHEGNMGAYGDAGYTATANVRTAIGGMSAQDMAEWVLHGAPDDIRQQVVQIAGSEDPQALQRAMRQLPKSLWHKVHGGAVEAMMTKSRRRGPGQLSMAPSQPGALSLAKGEPEPSKPGFMDKVKNWFGKGGDEGMDQAGEAPPGREEQVKELKHAPGVDNPYAVAWSSYNKSHGGSHGKDADGPGAPKKHFPTLDTPKPPPAPAQKKHFPTLASGDGGSGGSGRVGFYSPDVTGYVAPGTVGSSVPGADGSHLDVAERKPRGWGAGQKVRTTKMVVTRDRGGVRYVVPKGTQGTVLRDTDGADRAYYVKFGDLGFSTTVSKTSLR